MRHSAVQRGKRQIGKPDGGVNARCLEGVESALKVMPFDGRSL